MPMIAGAAAQAPASLQQPGGRPQPAVSAAPSTNVFLQLLIAQLRAQNPLEPQKGTEFITQLAQFNVLEQLIAIKAELQALRLAAEAASAQPDPQNR